MTEPTLPERLRMMKNAACTEAAERIETQDIECATLRHGLRLATDRAAELERELSAAAAREANDYAELLEELNTVKAQNVQLLNQLASAKGN